MVKIATNSTMLDKIKSTMSVPEAREWKKIDDEVSRMWRNFWIKVAHNHGYSNVAIAKEFGLTESTVRHILKK